MAYRFLIVDDSSIVRKVVKKTLAMSNLEISEVYEAENGQDALNTLEQNWVDLIFLDINMPIMNGIEFMEKLREHAELQNTPVIVVSTEGSSERIARLEQLGVKAYLRKPFQPEIVAQKVTSILHGGAHETK